MKHLIFIILPLSILILACAEKTNTKVLHNIDVMDSVLEVPDTIVDHSALHYNNKTSRWTLNDQLYSGYTLQFYEDQKLKEKIGFLNGKKQNQATQWYSDGHLKQRANYHKGKLHGSKERWSPDTNHFLISQLNYHLGKAHGIQTTWYPSGELFKKLHLNMGKEEGIQQAFRKNGDLYANYEAREGRIFGLKKAALCFGVEDENVQYER